MQFLSVPQSSLKALAIQKLKRKQLVAVQNSHHYPQLTLEYCFLHNINFLQDIYLYKACWSWCIRKRQIMAGTYIRKRLGSEYMEGKCNQELPGRTIDYSPGYIYILHTIYYVMCTIQYSFSVITQSESVHLTSEVTNVQIWTCRIRI